MASRGGATTKQDVMPQGINKMCAHLSLACHKLAKPSHEPMGYTVWGNSAQYMQR